VPVAPGETIDPERTKAKILRAALDLFYAQGVNATGVDEVTARAGVSKRSLYRHFDSKERLVDAVLRDRSDRTVAWLSEASARPDDPVDRVLAVFDALYGWFGQRGYRGCAIVAAASESRNGTPARRFARTHLTRHRDLLTRLAREVGCREPERIGRQLLVLLEGATVVSAMAGDRHAAMDARAAAEALVRADREPHA
jgi:AcrR family transcriptional regulator